MTTTTEALSSAYSALEDHAQLMKAVQAGHVKRRALVASLSSSSTCGITLPDLPARSPSPESPSTQPREPDPHREKQLQQLQRTDLPPEKLDKVRRYQNYVPEEETIRNDYSQQYVDSGEWPQNWVLGAELEKRFEEYPKQQKLLSLKQAAVNAQSHVPVHLPLASLPLLLASKFDVILIDPPYSMTPKDPPYGGIDWDKIAELPVPSLAADPSFIFMWVGHGNSDGLERGREVLAKWGFRRCEDIVWVKSNKTANRGPGTDPFPVGGVMTRTTEHCLMGIRGTVRRSNDGWFAHCNIDTDVIIWEGDPTDGLRKPPEMYSLIENFCLGTRRLELFGRASSLRRGWVTVGDLDDAAYELEKVNGKSWDKETYDNEVSRDPQSGRFVVTMPGEVEILRPKSPNRPERNNQNRGHHPSPNHAHSGMRMGPPIASTMATPGFHPNTGGMHGMMVQPGRGMPMQVAGGGGSFGNVPMPMAAVGHGNPFIVQQHQDMGIGMRPTPGVNPMVMMPGMMMGNGNNNNMNPMHPLPQNPPMRLGGGPMQAIPMQQGAAINPSMMNVGGIPLPMRPSPLGIMGQGQGGMAPVHGMATSQGMMGMPGNMGMGGGQMQMPMQMNGMGGMTMGPRMGGGGMMQFPPNTQGGNWGGQQQQQQQQQGGNWNAGGGTF